MQKEDYVKKPFTEHEYTEEQILILKKCYESYYNFLPYIFIKGADGSTLKFKDVIRDYQIEIINNIIENRFFVGLLSRQSGKTVTILTYILYHACFNSNISIGIVSNKERTAKSILNDKFKFMYENLEPWLKPGVLTYNETSIIFDNNTRILCSATSPDAFRGETLNLLFADEYAFVRPSIASDFWAANYPTIVASPNSKIIVISTPNGLYDPFHILYTNAENGLNTFKSLKSDWREVPGRDEKWAEETKKNLGERRFKQEMECDFLGSTNTLIDTDILKLLLLKIKNPILNEFKNSFRIYEKPIEGNVYIIGCDPSKGTGQNDSAIQVLKLVDKNPFKLEQVAVYNNNKIDVYSFSDLIVRIAIYYNNAYLMIENNGEGSPVVNKVWWDLEYMNLVNSGNKMLDLGIRATKNTKPKANLLLKKLIEDDSLLLYDEETIKQLASYIEEKGKYGGSNNKDDLISALCWGCYIYYTETLFDENSNTNLINSIEDDGWGILSDIEIESAF